jgi:hypothetical protein
MYVELASGSSTVAEDLIHDYEVNGLSPASVPRTRAEKMAKYL